MKPKRRRPTAEEIAESRAAMERLRERIAYHKAKLPPEERDKPAMQLLRERIAFHRAKLAGEGSQP
jgi:hypothetical protein